MKTSHFIIIILAIALVFATVKIATDNPPANDTVTADAVTGASPSGKNKAYDCIMSRSSVRAYSDKAVTDSRIDSLLRAAMAAPTAKNQQPWHIVVITDRAILDSIAANLPNIKMAAQSQLAIAICGNLDKAIEGEGKDYWIQDCSAATENLLLAAHSMGLGAVWCGIYPITPRVEFISSLLQLPANLIPLNIIPIGYPAAPQSPKEKFDSTAITYLR